MGLQRSETVVIHGHRLGHDLDDSAIALAGHPPVLFAVNPVLNVEMDGPPLGELPALPRIEAAVNVVRRVVDRGEIRDIDLLQDGFQQVMDALGIIAVDTMLVFVDQPDTSLLSDANFVPHPVEHVAAPVVPIAAALGQVVTEHADVRCVE